MALADEMNPFDVGDNIWMSLERFEDKESRFPSTDEASDEITSPPEMMAEQQASEKAMDEGTQQSLKTETPPAVQPIRPLVLPVMPGLSQGFEVRVDATPDDSEELSEDEKAPAVPSRPLNLPVMPGINGTGGAKETALDNKPIEDGDWKDAQVVAKDFARGRWQTTLVPFNVRLTTRPEGHATAAQGAPIIRPRDLTTKEPTAGPTKQKAKAEDERKQKQENPEACEALKAFRKKQLAAIESDRQTLNALQAAIAELGLENQIDFTGKGSEMNTQPNSDRPASGEAVNKTPGSIGVPTAAQDGLKK